MSVGTNRRCNLFGKLRRLLLVEVAMDIEHEAFKKYLKLFLSYYLPRLGTARRRLCDSRYRWNDAKLFLVAHIHQVGEPFIEVL